LQIGKQKRKQSLKGDKTMSTAITAEAWAEQAAANTSITTEELDRRALEYNEAWDKYEAQKEIASELYQAAIALEGKMVEAMEQAGKRKYHVEGVGTFSFTEKMSVKTPKTVEEKQLLAKYLEKEGGKNFFWDMFGVNSNTLQALYKSTFEEYKKKCELEGKPEMAAAFELPGVGAPTLMRSLKLTPDKKGK
jgi:hypothetical protein